MPKSSALFTVCFVAGMLGVLVTTWFLWGCNEANIFNLIKVDYQQLPQRNNLYGNLFVGGFWGLGYFFTIGVPRHRRHWIRKGLWFSLIPALTAIFYLYPQVYNLGMAGFDLGMLTPLVIVISNLSWGLFTGFFARLLWGQ